MTWLFLALLAAAALAPVGLALLRPAAPRARGRAETDRALYRAQRAELDRDREAGRLDEATHHAALLEVQRRLLGAPSERGGEAAGEAAPMPPPDRRPFRRAATMLALLALIPAASVGLYLWQGTPGLPSAPYRERAERAARMDAALAQLREAIARRDPHDERVRQGYVMLGGIERDRGRLDAAAAAWRTALEARFDPVLAGDLAETEIERGDTDAASHWIARALMETPGDPRLRYLAGLAEAQAGRPETARAAWRALLADAPTDAPWRALVERRLNALP